MIHCTFNLTGLSSRLSTRGNAAAACVCGLKVGEAFVLGSECDNGSHFGLLIPVTRNILNIRRKYFLKKTLYLDTTFPGWSRPMEFPFPFDISPASSLDFWETNISTALHNI